MLIRALCDYYDVLAANGKLIEEGFSEVDVKYVVILSPDGTITGINDIQVSSGTGERGKSKPVKCQFPFFKNERSIKAYRIDHRGKYIFGMLYDAATNKMSVTDKTKVLNDKFKEKNLDFIEDINDPTINAFRKFLENYVPEDETNNPFILGLKKDVEKANFCFILDGYKYGYLQDNSFIQEKIRREAAPPKTDSLESICSISGKMGEIPKIHYDIKGIADKNGPLVCVKHSAGESYGKVGALTSGISQESMEKYTKALNWLCQKESTNKIVFGKKNKITVLFFSMNKESEGEDDFVRFLLSGSGDSSANVFQQVKSLMSHIQKGDATEKNKISVVDTADYYIVGFTANGSRICMKFCYRDTFGNLLENVLKHQKDISIVKMGERPVTFNMIADELIRPSTDEKEDTVPAPLFSSLMESVLYGRKYPDSMFYTLIERIKIDKDKEEKIKSKGKEDRNLKKQIKLNPVRAGLIKAYLNRNYKEDFTMSLDENRKDTAYLCGRLFNILEFIQRKAQGKDINTTIKDSYFSTACSTPAIVFPQLLMLAQNHLKKIGGDEAYKLHKRIGLIINDIDNFPTTLSAIEQGRFFIGYYHQDNWYLKNSTDTDKNE